MKKLLDDLKQNPRIELIPALLNLPIVIAVLILLLVVPDVKAIINDAAENIFAIEGDLSTIVTWIFAFLFIFISCLTILTLFRREKTPAWLHLIPGMLFPLYEIILLFVINNNAFVTINYIYENIGYSLSLLVYLTLVSVLLICAIVLLHGIPKLWNKKPDDKSRFRPRTVVIISIINSFLAFSFIGLLLIGHHSMIFWQVILYDVDWNAFPTIFHETGIIAFVILYIVQSKKNYFISRFHLVDSKLTKFFLILKPLVLISQIITIILIGTKNGFSTIFLNPLSLFTYAECLYYLFHDFIFLRSNQLFSLTKLKKKEHQIITTIAVGSFIWIVLFQPLISVPPEPILPEIELNVVRNTYATLSLTQKTLFDSFMNNTFYPNATLEGIMASLSERGLSRLASGLLFRNFSGDIENASIVLNRLMDGNNNVNFIGCELIVIMERHQSKLDPALVSRINARLILIAEDAYRTNVRPTYTNMALMSTFVMEWVGLHMDRPELLDAGIRKSWGVFLLFQRHNTFSEFNSPTYGGVDMVALTMWRELGPTETMRRMGAIMEQTYWKEISLFYHAGFRNMVGPYFRKYGMDMCSYTAILGIWIALVVDDLDKAPLPKTIDNENQNIVSAVQMGHSIPSFEILQEFAEFSSSRFLERRIPSDISDIGKEYIVTAMLNSKWMMGGVSGRIYAGGQFVTGTLSWNSTDDSYAWLLVSGKDNLDVIISNSSMQICQTKISTSIVFYINCHNITTDMINGNMWSLPGMKLKIDVDPSKITTEVIDKDQFRQDFELRENIEDIVKVTCLTDQISLQINN